ncbi:MAG: CHASE4 domain-containing protein [Sphingomonadaceae bacterium]|jgi:signal transduction histidine kinase
MSIVLDRGERRTSALSRVLTMNLAVIGVLATIAIFFVLSFFINASFTRMEEEQLRGHVDRVGAFLAENRNQMKARSSDWAVWDESYDYASDFNAGYEKRNVNAAAFINAQVDGLAIVRFDGKGDRSFAFDRESEEAAPALAHDLKTLVTSAAFRAQSRKSFQGFALLNGKIYSIGSAPLLRNDRSGVSPGNLVFIEELTSENASHALQVKAMLDLRAPAQELSIVKQADRIQVAAPILDTTGKPIASIRFNVPRRLLAAGAELRNIVAGAVLVLVIIMLMVLNRRVSSLVIGPVKRLQAHVQRIKESGEMEAFEGPIRDDEIGALKQAFNDMTIEMNALRAQIESQSFALGKSQSTVTLMHNVRNSLSPVGVLIGIIERQMADLFPPNTERALEELKDDAAPQDRRQKLASFLEAAHGRMKEQIEENRQNAREAARSLSVALDAISDAQRNESARADSSAQDCDIGPMLSRSANVVRYAEGSAIEVDIACNERIEVRCNRILLGQILENLFTNAREAIDATGRQDGALSISAIRDADQATCTVTIADNGEGFDPAAVARLFERGFSTREQKSGGFGLHWCANTLNALGGNLSLESDGVGKGARAILVLPLASAEQEEPAARDAA